MRADTALNIFAVFSARHLLSTLAVWGSRSFVEVTCRAKRQQRLLDARQSDMMLPPTLNPLWADRELSDMARGLPSGIVGTALKPGHGRAPLEIAEFASGCLRRRRAGHITAQSGYQASVRIDDP